MGNLQTRSYGSIKDANEVTFNIQESDLSLLIFGPSQANNVLIKRVLREEDLTIEEIVTARKIMEKTINKLDNLCLENKDKSVVLGKFIRYKNIWYVKYTKINEYIIKKEDWRVEDDYIYQQCKRHWHKYDLLALAAKWVKQMNPDIYDRAINFSGIRMSSDTDRNLSKSI